MQSAREIRMPMKSTAGRSMRRIATFVTSLAIGMVTVVASVTPAQATDLGKVSSISLKDKYSEVTFAFDQPISAADADAIRASMSGKADSVRTADVTPVYCWNGGGWADAHASFTYQYTCGTPHKMQWGIQLSAANQATVVGLVSEGGLTWWCDYVWMGQNGSHSAPASYIFHGVMNPVFPGVYVDSQDYFTWRHNIGPGGTASLTVVGGTLYTVI